MGGRGGGMQKGNSISVFGFFKILIYLPKGYSFLVPKKYKVIAMNPKKIKIEMVVYIMIKSSLVLCPTKLIST